MIPFRATRPADRIHVARPSLALTFSSALYILTGYGVSVGLARILGPAHYGEYAVVTALLTIVNLVVARGVPVVASRAISQAPDRLPEIVAGAWRATGIVVAVTGTTALIGA